MKGCVCVRADRWRMEKAVGLRENNKGASQSERGGGWGLEGQEAHEI